MGFAVGIAVLLLGVILGWLIVAIGAVITAIFGFLWIREVTSDVREAPPPEEPVARAARPAVPSRLAAPEPGEGEIVRFPRSKFLEGATLGLGAVIGGIVTLPVAGMALADPFIDQGTPEVDIGPIDDFPENRFVITTFLMDVAQGEVSRRTAYVRNNGTLDGQASFTIISNRCVHLGCPVQPQGLTADEVTEIDAESGPVEITATEPSGFVCPCHGGAYDIEGNRTAGPPVRALDRYAYSIMDGRLVLGEPYSVGSVEGEGAEAQIKAYKIADPGVHVDGLEQYFYPYVP